MAQRMATYSADARARVRGEIKNRAMQVEEKYARAVEELSGEESLLAEREGGTFDSDIPNWLQDNDDGYTHRMYDYGKIFSHREEFIGDVTKNLVALEGMSEHDASALANGLYMELLSRPVGRKYISSVQLRGPERARTFRFSSDVVAGWLDTDAQKMADRWSETVIPDHIIQEHIGTFDASTFQEEIKEQVVGLLEDGSITAGEVDKLVRTSVKQIQRMIDNVRGLSYPAGGAVWDSKAWQVGSATVRSLTSIASLGGLVYTSLFDVASTILNKGVFRTLAHDGTTMLKYLANKTFRKRVRGHPDMVAMSGWIDVLLRKGTNRMLADQGIPENYLTRVNKFLRTAEHIQMKITGAEAVFNSLHIAADYGNMLTISTIAEKVADGRPLSTTERSVLNIARISESQAKKIAQHVRAHGSTIDGVKHINLDAWGDSDSAMAMQYGVNALTKNGILTPGSEVPPFMRTPIGEVLFQYKKFILSGIDRCMLPALGRLSSGDMGIIGGLLIMISLGGLKEVLSRLASGRDMVTFDEFWEYGVGNCDALPLIGELFKDVALGFNSKGLTGGFSGAKNFILGLFLPPSATQGVRFLTATNGVTAIMSGKRKHLHPSEVAALKSSIPYNNTIYLNRLLNKILRNHIDSNDLNIHIPY
jgi:hypothetical protein